MKRGERQRFLQSHNGLLRVRADLKVYGVHFECRLVEHRTGSGLVEIRLIATMRGRVDNEQRRITDVDGNMTLKASQHTGFAAAAFAMSMVSPLYPNAIIENGGVMRDGSWLAEVWLNPSDAQVAEREAAAAAG